MNWVISTLRFVRRRALPLLLWGVLFTCIAPRASVNLADRTQAVAFFVSAHHFDYVGWTVQAAGAKLAQWVTQPHHALAPDEQTAFVRAYMRDLAQVQELESAIERAYSDPATADPHAATASQRDARDALRRQLEAQQSTVEAILETQVMTVLQEQGFGGLGGVFPPLAMRFTAMPYLLVTSPRETIRLETSLALNRLPLEQRVALEEAVARQYDVSALIVPLGGIALYPAMIAETANIAWAVEIFAHEWLHHYLLFYPLGLHYFTAVDGASGEARAINETTANYFGKEVARLVLARYYPDIAPPALPTLADVVPRPPVATPTPAFDLAAAMHETRVTTDALLAEGRVEEAEAYMEAQRALMHANGHSFRKINQAFFAFYGGYQAGGIAGIAGADPIGEAIIRLRERSPSLLAFVERVRGITRRADLLAAAGMG